MYNSKGLVGIIGDELSCVKKASDTEALSKFCGEIPEILREIQESALHQQNLLNNGSQPHFLFQMTLIFLNHKQF